MQTFPCFLVVRSVANELRGSALSGFRLAEAIVSEASEFQDINPGGVLPDLVWLEIDGTPGLDDFAITEKGQLIVSERALELLRANTLNTGSFGLWQRGD